MCFWPWGIQSGTWGRNVVCVLERYMLCKDVLNHTNTCRIRPNSMLAGGLCCCLWTVRVPGTLWTWILCWAAQESLIVWKGRPEMACWIYGKRWICMFFLWRGFINFPKFSERSVTLQQQSQWLSAWSDLARRGRRQGEQNAWGRCSDVAAQETSTARGKANLANQSSWIKMKI